MLSFCALFAREKKYHTTQHSTNINQIENHYKTQFTTTHTQIIKHIYNIQRTQYLRFPNNIQLLTILHTPPIVFARKRSPNRYTRQNSIYYSPHKTYYTPQYRTTNKMSLRPNTHLHTATMNENTFNTLQEIHAHHDEDADADTIITGKQRTLTRFQIMVSTSSSENSAEALLNATRNLLAALKNKVPTIKFAKWNDTSDSAKGIDIMISTILKNNNCIPQNLVSPLSSRTASKIGTERRERLAR